MCFYVLNVLVMLFMVLRTDHIHWPYLQIISLVGPPRDRMKFYHVAVRV